MCISCKKWICTTLVHALFHTGHATRILLTSQMRRICAVARRACRGPLPLRCMSQGQAPVSAASATVDPAEIAKFGRLASQWWDADGVFAGLHSMNAVRVPIIRQAAGAPLTVPDVPKPLHGVSIADIGCGGGILAEVRGMPPHPASDLPPPV